MADDSEATTDVPNDGFHDPRNVIETLRYAVQKDDDFDVRVHGDFTPHEADVITDAIDNAIGCMRSIVGDKQYIPARAYYEMVVEFTEECAEMFTSNPDWADGLTDEAMLLEVVMPTKYADRFPQTAYVDMWVCYHSPYTNEAIDRLDLSDYETMGALRSDVALYATMYAVASKLNKDHGLSVTL